MCPMPSHVLHPHTRDMETGSYQDNAQRKGKKRQEMEGRESEAIISLYMEY